MVSSETTKKILSLISANAFKDCTENGSWYVDPLTNKTWTDYTSCVPIEVSVLWHRKRHSHIIHFRNVER